MIADVARVLKRINQHLSQVEFESPYRN